MDLKQWQCSSWLVLHYSLTEPLVGLWTHSLVWDISEHRKRWILPYWPNQRKQKISWTVAFSAKTATLLFWIPSCLDVYKHSVVVTWHTFFFLRVSYLCVLYQYIILTNTNNSTTPVFPTLEIQWFKCNTNAHWTDRDLTGYMRLG